MASVEAPAGGDENRTSVLLGVTWSFTTVSLIFVALRIYSRVRHLNRLWWDDLFIVLGEVSWTSRSQIPNPYSSSQGSYDSLRDCHHHLRLRRRLSPPLLPIRSASLANPEAQLHLPSLRHHGSAVLQSLYRFPHLAPPSSGEGAYGSAHLLRQ